MIQKDYLFESLDRAIEGVAEIQGFVQSQPCADVLLTVSSMGVGEAGLRRFLAALDEALPEATRAGLTSYPYGLSSEGQKGAHSVGVNVMLSDAARFHGVQIPCRPGEEGVAARTFAERLADIPDVKGVALYPSNPAIDAWAFFRQLPGTMQGVPVFGAMAALADDSFNHLFLEGSFGIGADLLESGFTVAIFSGPDLQVSMDYVLGWRPVGKEMEPTVISGRPGVTCIGAIDGKPALDVYDKYLGVRWDADFVANVCEFPLMVQRNGVDLCMVPAAAGKDGELYLQGRVQHGEKLRFSYGTRESVLGSTLAGRDRMRDFGAQALLMWLCGNRAIFLGEDAHAEWSYYREVNPELAYFHGNYEIAWRQKRGDGNGYGGVLNSALVAVGFREGGASEGAKAAPVEGAASVADAGAIEGAASGTAQGAGSVASQGAASSTAQAANAIPVDSDAAHPARAGGEGQDGEPVGGSDVERREGLIPLTYRVSRFFDVMTGELVHLQHNLEHEVELKTRENENLMLHVVITLAAAIDAKDPYTNGHSGRVAAYSREIARRAGYANAQLDEIYMMGILHDVGKIGVPDRIINKAGKLTDEEFDAIKAHPETGARILAAIEEMPGLAIGAHWHHERYDGHGYPDGLAGEDIPEEARIIAVADAYDAMTSNRSYRDALPQEKVREQVVQGSGTQFDPRFASIMLEMIDDDQDYRMREIS